MCVINNLGSSDKVVQSFENEKLTHLHQTHFKHVVDLS